MKPRYLLAAGAFVAALLVGAWAADALRHEGAAPTLQPTAGEVIPVLPVVPVEAADLEALDDPDIPWAPVEVAAELVPVDRDAIPGGGDRGPEPRDPGFGDPAAPGETAEPDAPVETDDVPPPDPAFDFTIAGLDLPAYFFGDAPAAWHRFIDFCADASEDADCPFGVGATVLIDYEGPGEPGTFEISDTLYPNPSGWWRCEDPGRLRTGQYLLMILATHPSRMEITYFPSGEPESANSVVVDTSVPSHPELGQWLDFMTSTGGPATGQNRVQHCFILDGGRASRFITIEASATSLTGETDTHRFSFRTDENRRRPPVTFAPLSDYQATVAMPFQNDGDHTTVLRVIDATEGIGCTDIEGEAVFGRGRSDIVPLPDSGYRIWSGFDGSEPMGDDIIAADDWPYDPSYDTYHFWKLNLREGRAYQICMWWVQSPVRSFDNATVVDRESRWVLTPDRNVTRISVNSVRAPSGSGVAADSIRVFSRCITLRAPGVDLSRDESFRVPAGEGVLCDYNGYEQPDVTEITMVTDAGDEFTFAIPSPSDAEIGMGVVRVNLDVERRSGLCGSSFGPCDPPTTVYPGPQVTLLVETHPGEDSGREDWFVRGPETFAAQPAEPLVLPESPQIDQFGSGLTAIGRDRLQVVAEFDRPVSLIARLRGAPDDPCLLGGVQEMAVTELRQSHSLSFGGLCALREYAVDLIVTDAEGHTVTFSPNPTDDGVPWSPWYGFGYTEGWPVRFIVGLQVGLVGDYRTYRSDVAISGSTISRIDLRPENRCLTAIQSREQVGEWRDTVTVQIDIGFFDGIRDAAGVCQSTRFGVEWSGSATAEISIDDLRAGPIQLTVMVSDPEGFLVPVGIRITGRVG